MDAEDRVNLAHQDKCVEVWRSTGRFKAGAEVVALVPCRRPEAAQ